MENNGNDIFTDIIQRLKDLEIARNRLNQEETRLLNRLEVENARRAQVQRVRGPNNNAPPHTFAVNDRVHITNIVRRPRNWDVETAWDERAAHRATVTSVELERVHFVTDNGISTWRAPQNLRLIERQE
jgi:hypothetical protein